MDVARLNTKKTLGNGQCFGGDRLGATYSLWWPTFSSFIDRTLQQRRAVNAPVEEHAGHDHGAEGHEDHAGHDHAAHDESTALELNAQSLKNLGLSSDYLKPIELSDYKRTITIPAIVAAKPGRTQIRVSSPLSGVVTHVMLLLAKQLLQGLYSLKSD